MLHALAVILPYRYIALVPFAIFGGQMFAFVAGTLVRYGYFNPIIAYGIFVAADLLGDTFYYFLGRHETVVQFLHRSGRQLGLTEDHFEVLVLLWQRHTWKTMFVVKYALALTGPLLVSAGLARLPAKRYYAATLSITVAQYVVFMGLGFGLASAFGEVSDILRALQIGATITALFVFYILFVGRLRRTWLLQKRSTGYTQEKGTV